MKLPPGLLHPPNPDATRTGLEPPAVNAVRTRERSTPDYAAGAYDRLNALAMELVRENVDVIA